MRNSQMFAIMGVTVLSHQMNGWAAISLGILYFVMALAWLRKDY